MKTTNILCRFKTFACLVTVLLFCPSILATETKNQNPNVLFIMVDDMGYSDLGVTGSRQSVTPNLDNLAEQGLLLTNAYANAAVCSPTRTALMTGNYQARFAVGLPEPLGEQNIGLPQTIATLPSVFKSRGYETYLVGKWHLGEPPEYGPMQRGYDHFFGFYPGAADYFTHNLRFFDQFKPDLLHEDDKPVDKSGYLTELFANKAIQIIEESSEDTPFMISLHFNAPHWPWEGPEDEAMAESIQNSLHYDGGSLKKYQEMMRYMDTSVGRVLAALQEKGLDDNTIVVFTSDNGAERYSETWPYTGAKGSLLEGGIRVPIIIRWPGHIDAGSVSTQMMMSMDFLPTLAAATGQPVNEQEFDGINLLPVLTGNVAKKERTFYWRYKTGTQAATRRGDWKYFRSDGEEWLFNITKNPHERAQLKDKYPDKFKELKAAWMAWDAEMLPYPEDMLSGRVKDSNP